MPKTPINGIDLYYQVEGADDGDWLIFSNGGGGTHVNWWRQVLAFRDRYKCLTYDSRGLGQSSGEEETARGAEDLFALMEHLGIRQAYLNGHSAGGSAVSGIAQKHPERVLGLIMTNTPFGFQTAALKKWAAGMMEGFGKGFDIRDHSVAPYFAAHDPQEAFLRQCLSRLNSGVRPRDPADYKVRFGEAYGRMRDDPAVDYSGFKVPTLFVAGDVDGLTVPWLLRGTAKVVGGARLAVIPRCGHWPLLEQHEVYNALLDEFLQSTAQKRRDPGHQPPAWSLIEYFDALSGRV